MVAKDLLEAHTLAEGLMALRVTTSNEGRDSYGPSNWPALLDNRETRMCWATGLVAM